MIYPLFEDDFQLSYSEDYVKNLLATSYYISLVHGFRDSIPALKDPAVNKIRKDLEQLYNSI